jgi:aspartate carbamoyltransferase catalytic subunit
MSRNLISIDDLSDFDLLHLTSPEAQVWHPPSMLRGTLAFLFEQSSLRTMSSFASAATRIGLAPIAITTKGGAFRDQCDLYDELDQLSLTSDCVVVRAGTELDRARLESCAAPVINAGDASNEHPTQTVLDIAVMRSLGLFGKTVAIVGNLRDHRTAHSLAKGLGRLPVNLRLVAPDGMAMADRYIAPHAEVVVANTVAEVDKAIADVDFIYLPPVRYWNSPDLDFMGAYDFDLNRAERVFKLGARILHPFPRFAELDRSLDGSRFDAYRMQTSMGRDVRERILRLILSLPSRVVATAEAA